MKYGYARVSTRGQQHDGNSLADQKQKLYESGCDVVMVEQYTGTTMDRPVFSKLLDTLKPGDTLKVTKLDRFARSASEGSKIAKTLLDDNIALHIINMGMIDNTSTGRLLLNILLSFSEYERDMIVERTQAGKEIARTKEGYREGRPPIDQKRKQTAISLVNQGYSYNEVSDMTGLSKSTVVRAVRAYRAKEVLQ